MHDSTLMKIPDCVNDGADDISGFFFGVYNFFYNFIVELSSWEVLKYEIDVFGICVVIVEFDDIGMLYIFHDMYFSLQ